MTPIKTGDDWIDLAEIENTTGRRPIVALRTGRRGDARGLPTDLRGGIADGWPLAQGVEIAALSPAAAGKIDKNPLRADLREWKH
ncbi:MAG: hypothetical protein Q8L66_07595 [Caulobacter sp.]|nr:hypothetical protein [Caulobacter sp.]